MSNAQRLDMSTPCRSETRHATQQRAVSVITVLLVTLAALCICKSCGKIFNFCPEGGNVAQHFSLFAIQNHEGRLHRKPPTCVYSPSHVRKHAVVQIFALNDAAFVLHYSTLSRTMAHRRFFSPAKFKGRRLRACRTLTQHPCSRYRA